MRQVALLLVASLLFCGCAQQVQTLSPDKLTPFTDSANGYSVSYPQGWMAIPNENASIGNHFKSVGEQIMVLGPLPLGAKSLNVEGEELAAYLKDVAVGKGAQVAVDFDGASVVHGYAAYIIVEENKADTGGKVKVVVIQSKKNPSDAYAIFIGASKNIYAQDSATFDAVVESFTQT